MIMSLFLLVGPALFLSGSRVDGLWAIALLVPVTAVAVVGMAGAGGPERRVQVGKRHEASEATRCSP